MTFQNFVRGSLRRFQRGKTFGKFTSNPIRNKNQSIPLHNWKHCGLQRGQLRSDDAGTQQQALLHGSLLRPSADQCPLHVADAGPSHHAMLRVNGSKAQHDTARQAELLVAALYQRDDRFVRTRFENGNRCLRRVGSLFSMSNSVNRRDQNSTPPTANQMLVARFTLTRENKLRHTILHQRLLYCFPFFTFTIVPPPGLEGISTSSITPPTPRSPSPRLPEVEKPSRKAWRISRIPRPSSAAITRMPTQLQPSIL